MASTVPLMKYHDGSDEFDQGSDTEEKRLSRQNYPLPFCSALSALMWAATAFTVILSLFNISLLWNRAFPSKLELLQLPVIHSYAGIDELAKAVNHSYEETLSILNHPRLMTQVSSADPGKAWPDIDQIYNPEMGTVSPDARRFHVEPTINTVAQFRVVDYGMENCHIHVNPGPILGNPSRWGWPAPRITVWRLTGDEKLEAKALSWKTKPARSHVLAHWELNTDQAVTTPSFNCAWGTHPTFEFEVETPGVVDFLDNPREDSPSVILVQRSSLVDHVD